MREEEKYIKSYDGELIYAKEFTVEFPIATIILCLLKTGVAGYVSGLIYELLHKQNNVLSIILASIIVPIINTGLFIVGTLLFFVPLLEQWAGSSDIYSYLFLTLIGINFVIFEICVQINSFVH